MSDRHDTADRLEGREETMKTEERTPESKTTTERTLAAGRYLVGGVALLLLLALVAPFVVYGFPGVIGADASFVVLSGSMEPGITAGDAVIVDSVRPGQIAVGDVITFTRDGTSSPITHRVVEATGQGAAREFVTKGDANEEADARTVPAANVVGRVVLTLPYVGLVVDFANTQPGFLLFVALPIGLLILNEAYTFVRKPSKTASAEESAAAADDWDEDGTGEADDPDATVQFTRADLTYTTGALGLFAAYAAYVAVLVDTSAVTVAFLVAVVGVFALVAAIRYGAPTSEEALVVADGGTALTRENRIVRGEIPEKTHGLPTVTVGSLTDIVAMAREENAWIVHEGDRLYFVTDETVFTHAIDADLLSTDDGDEQVVEAAPSGEPTLPAKPDAAADEEGER